MFDKPNLPDDFNQVFVEDLALGIEWLRDPDLAGAYYVVFDGNEENFIHIHGGHGKSQNTAMRMGPDNADIGQYIDGIAEVALRRNENVYFLIEDGSGNSITSTPYYMTPDSHAVFLGAGEQNPVQAEILSVNFPLVTGAGYDEDGDEIDPQDIIGIHIHPTEDDLLPYEEAGFDNPVDYEEWKEKIIESDKENGISWIDNDNGKYALYFDDDTESTAKLRDVKGFGTSRNDMILPPLGISMDVIIPSIAKIFIKRKGQPVYFQWNSEGDSYVVITDAQGKLTIEPSDAFGDKESDTLDNLRSHLPK